MANLQGFNANDHDPIGDFDALPPGQYLAMATDSEMKPTKSGSGSYLQIVWEVIDGEYKGRKLWSRLNLDNPNRTAVEIAQRELSSICRAVEVMKPEDSAELHGKPLVLKVGTEKRADTGELSNRVKGYASAAKGIMAPPTMSSSDGKPPWKQ